MGLFSTVLAAISIVSGVFHKRLYDRSLASDAACAHVTVVRYTGVGDAVYDNLAKLHDPEDFWNLSVNFHPGLAKHPWQVKHRAATTSGNDDAQTIARQNLFADPREGRKGELTPYRKANFGGRFEMLVWKSSPLGTVSSRHTKEAIAI
jgi:hypothetical protein